MYLFYFLHYGHMELANTYIVIGESFISYADRWFMLVSYEYKITYGVTLAIPLKISISKICFIHCAKVHHYLLFFKRLNRFICCIVLFSEIKFKKINSKNLYVSSAWVVNYFFKIRFTHFSTENKISESKGKPSLSSMSYLFMSDGFAIWNITIRYARF